MRKKVIIGLSLIVLWLIVCFIYSRPMTLSQLYPVLTLEQCTEIHGYYNDGTKEGMTEFVIDRDCEQFEELWNLFFERDYCRSVRDILPKGTRIHRTQPGDFQWEVYFDFEDIGFPDGSSGSGSMLSVQYWYGDLDIYFDGGVHSCRTSGQKEWAQKILDVLHSD